MLRMCLKHFYSFWWILIFIATNVSSSEWKPIVPPPDYYATMPTICDSNCKSGNQHPHQSNAGNTEAGEYKSWSHQRIYSNYRLEGLDSFAGHSDLLRTKPKLDLELFKPKEVPFFPQESDHVKSPHSSALSYRDIFRKAPSPFLTLKTYESFQKPSKTLYYGEPELLKSKISDKVKFISAAPSQSFGSDVKFLVKPKIVHTDLKPYRHFKINAYEDNCNLYKVSFRQDLYYQYVQYKTRMPDLKEFTICMWIRLYNHSYDHSLFSYEVKPMHKDIYMWISNLNEPGQFNMKVMGQTIFRLYYPIKLYKWYHTCQSWNGHTGEWQVWVNSHRLGRGFHNLLVGHKIPGGGLSISGQSHTTFGKGATYFFKESGGLEGEIVMLQMYKVALTAGKAYTDHRHHHSHYTSTTPEPPDESSEEETPTTTHHPFLENGQLKTHINILELAKALKSKKHLDILDHDSESEEDSKEHFHYFPYVSPLTPLVLHSNYLGLPDHAVFKRDGANGGGSKETKQRKSESVGESSTNNDESESPSKRNKVLNKVSQQVRVEKIKFSDEKNKTENFKVSSTKSGRNGEIQRNVKFNHSQEPSSKSSTSEEHFEESEEIRRIRRTGRVKRHNSHKKVVVISRSEITSPGILKSTKYVLKKRREPPSKSTNHKVIEDKDKEPSKRQITIEDNYLGLGSPGFAESTYFGGLGYPHEFLPLPEYDYGADHDHGEEHGDEYNPLHHPKDEGDEPPQPELAESEVRRVMDICSGCGFDPFRKVAVISWRSTPKKIFSGALLLKAQSECEHF